MWTHARCVVRARHQCACRCFYLRKREVVGESSVHAEWTALRPAYSDRRRKAGKGKGSKRGISTRFCHFSTVVEQEVNLSSRHLAAWRFS